MNERVAVAELAIAQTKKRSNQAPEKAIPHYLEATEALWPIINNTTPAVITGNSRNQKNRLILAEKLYQHAVGQIARLSLQGSPITSSQQSIKIANNVIRINTDSPYSIHPSFFDRLRPVNTSSYGNVGQPHHKANGLGAALIGHQSRSSERLKSNQFIPFNGINMPINAIIDYPQPHRARLTLTNLHKTTTTQITGERRILAADYSAAIAASASMQPNRLGLSTALRPHRHVDRVGLFSLEPYDPNKIPIILIHGLASEPSTWTSTINYLIADPVLRQNYQLLYYFYSTSYPAIISGARLRKTLLSFYQSHADEHNSKLNQTVLIGHSMGGLLSSVQSRTFDQDLWNQLFEKLPDKHGPDSAYAQFKVLFEPPYLPQIKRTIFIATPHRGSKLADRWAGKIGASLMKLPQSVMSLEIEHTKESLTALGRSLINQGPRKSTTQLKSNNPALKLLENQPFNPNVTYHSIIGDRGTGKGNKSSDGVVPYWSSHLDGAASEKFVPTNHEAHLHLQTHEEISRILHLHLKSSR